MSRPPGFGRLAVLLGIAVLAAACGTKQDTTTTTPAPKPLPVATVVSANMADAVAADDQLGLDLLGAAGQQGGNVVVSPASVALALQMVASGAGGRTATEMAHVLHLPNANSASAVAKQLLDSLGAVTNDSANTLRVANTVWAQQGMPINSAYSATLRDKFNGATRSADFQRDPNQATDEIDHTISDQTNGLVPQLFPPGSLDNTTRLVLTNAVYLAASWAQAFEPKLTAPASFTKQDGSVVQVPMMHQDTVPDPRKPPAFGYADGAGYQVVTVPYTGGKLAFNVLLPAGHSLAPLMETLRANGLSSVLAAVKPTDVDFSMPKFTISTNLDLTGTLAQLGMPTAFSDKADFSGITTAEPLHIQTVQHDAKIQVDEHGTVAAGATGVGVATSAMPARNVVVVNRPFLFVITDTKTGAPLFLGQVTNG